MAPLKSQRRQSLFTRAFPRGYVRGYQQPHPQPLLLLPQPLSLQPQPLPQPQNRMRIRMMIQQQLLPPKLKHDIMMSSLKIFLRNFVLPSEAFVSCYILCRRAFLVTEILQRKRKTAAGLFAAAYWRILLLICCSLCTYCSTSIPKNQYI